MNTLGIKVIVLEKKKEGKQVWLEMLPVLYRVEQWNGREDERFICSFD